MMHYGYSWGYAGLHLHAIAVLLTLIGVVLFIIWAANNLKKKELSKMAAYFIVSGIILGALSGLIMQKYQTTKGDKDYWSNSMMDEMVENMGLN